MPDDLSHYAIVDGRPAADAIEDARRWLDRAEKCERRGCMWNHCMSEAEAAIGRAGLIVVGDITSLLRSGNDG